MRARSTFEASLLAVVLAVFGPACSEGQSASNSPNLDRIEAALRPGARVAQGPDAELIDALTLGASRVDALAVRIVEGQPRAVTIIFRHEPSGGDRELEEIVASGDGEKYIADIANQVDSVYGAREGDLVVAFCDESGFRILGRREPGHPLRYQRAPHDIRTILERHLSREPGPRVRLPKLTLDEERWGRLGGPPNRPSAYRIELTHPQDVLVQLAFDVGVDVLLKVCPGELNPLACVDRVGIPPADTVDQSLLEAIDDRAEELEDEGRELSAELYRLSSGATTIVLEPECSYDQTPCRQRGASFSLTATRHADGPRAEN